MIVDEPEAQLFSFYDVLDIVSLPENYLYHDVRKNVSDAHLAAVTLAVAKGYLPLDQSLKVKEELMEEFSESEWATIEFMSSINVSLGEPRSSARKAMEEAKEMSIQDGSFGFIAVPKFQKFPNGDHKILAVWFEKPKYHGTLN